MGKNLVAYFSASGITKKLASEMADVMGAELYEIKPQVPYTKADLDWMDKGSRSTLEMADAASRPVIEGQLPDISAYDNVFLGFPIWWYVAPTIINTFLEGADFSGKTIVTFATSGGSGMGETLKRLRPSCSDSVIWKEGPVFKKPDRAELAAWIESLGL